MSAIIFFISWYLAGFISMIYMWIQDMRHEEFDKDYFNIESILVSLLVFAFGYISVIFLYWHWSKNNRPFTKLIYKIANIGVKRKEENKEGEEE